MFSAASLAVLPERSGSESVVDREDRTSLGCVADLKRETGAGRGQRGALTPRLLLTRRGGLARGWRAGFHVGGPRGSKPMRCIGFPQQGQVLTHGGRGSGRPGVFQSSKARMRCHLVRAAGLHQP